MGKGKRERKQKRRQEAVRSGDGRIYEIAPEGVPEIERLLEENKARFRAKYGRDPGPKDPIFFDAPPLEAMEHYMAESMRKAGIPERFVYAFEKTGRILTEAAAQNLTPEELEDYKAALHEYDVKHGADVEGDPAPG